MAKCIEVQEGGERHWRLTDVVGEEDGLGIECLSGSGAIARYPAALFLNGGMHVQNLPTHTWKLTVYEACKDTGCCGMCAVHALACCMLYDTLSGKVVLVTHTVQMQSNSAITHPAHGRCLCAAGHAVASCPLDSHSQSAAQAKSQVFQETHACMFPSHAELVCHCMLGSTTLQ